MRRNFELKDYFKWQRRLLRVGGLSLRENEHFVYRIYALCITLLMFVYLVVLSIDVVQNSQDFDVIINTIYHEIAIITVLSKMRVTSFNGKQLDKTLEMLEKGVFAPNPERGGPVEEKWIRECVGNANWQIIVGCILVVTSTFVPIIATIIKRFTTSDNNRWELPFGKFSVFKTNRSPNFEMAWFFQSVMFPIAGLIYVSTDFLVAGVFSHICVQFRILQNSIRRIVDGDDAKEDLGTLDEESIKFHCKHSSKRLKQNVIYHKAIIDLANQFEEIFSLLTLVNILAVMFALGCIMYHGSLYSPWDPRFQKDALLYLAVVFQLFVVSYWGNEVMLESQTVIEACYDANFIKMDVRLQRDLCMMMARSQKPIKFTAGKFADLSLVSFVAIMRASFSYYMVLHSRNEKKTDV